MRKYFFLFLLLAESLVIWADKTQINGIYYLLDNENLSAAVTAPPSSSYSGNIVIPETVSFKEADYVVNAVDSFAFAGCTLQSIHLPNTLTSIGKYAFYNTWGFTSIDIPEGVTSIPFGAFISSHNLSHVNLPSTLLSIGDFAFFECENLCDITIPSSVTSLGMLPFESYQGVIIRFQSCTPPSVVVYEGGSELNMTFPQYYDYLAIVPNGAASDYRTLNGWGQQFCSVSERYRVEMRPWLAYLGHATCEVDCETSTAILTAIPDEGARFASWEDGNTDNPRSVSLTSDTAFIPRFESEDVMKTIDITVNEPDWGSVVGAGTYNLGAWIACEAIPAEGCEFVKWEFGRDSYVDNPLTVCVSSDFQLRAVFKKTSSALENILSSPKAVKLLREGRLYILTSDGRLYDCLGRSL